MNRSVEIQKIQCLDCEGVHVTERLVEQQFQYGPTGSGVMLKAMVPVLSCQDCGYEFFDERGEQARHAAVCRHLGVHTPEDIASLRSKASLSRAEACALTGFGIASWQRWESGAMPPNTSSDRLLYLLNFPENVRRLQERRRNAQLEETAPPSTSNVISIDRPLRCSSKRFERFPNPQRVMAQAQAWALRK